MITPWGKADRKEIIAPGITFYSTPRHGGYKVNKKQRLMMPPQWQNADGWYEEDCEYLKVILSFPQHFSQTLVDHANRTYKRFFNDEGMYR